MTLFVMEKELRSLKGRGHFPMPTITPHGSKVENSHQVTKMLEAVVEEITRIATIIRESERAYEKEQEEAKQQTRATRSTQRTEYNFLSLNSSTPIKNTGRAENRHHPPERTTHFNPNAIHHFYPMTKPTSRTDRYEQPVNDSIILGAGTAPGQPPTYSMTRPTGCDKTWRNTSTNTAPQQIFPP